MYCTVCTCSDFDAFVILHGTDTLCYTASALSFILENLGKPVLITGSQVPPLSRPRPRPSPARPVFEIVRTDRSGLH